MSETHTVSTDVTHEQGETRFCQTIDDFYTREARRVIFRLTSEFCIQNKVTATELLYNPDLVTKLENAGTAMLNAVQKQAATYSAAVNIPIRDSLNHYNRLILQATERVEKDRRKNVFPAATLETFADLADTLAKAPNGLYLLNGALVFYLRDATRWSEKITLLVGLLEVVRPGTYGGRMLREAIDEILAEMVSVPAALFDLYGPQASFGEALVACASLLNGKAQKSRYAEEKALSCLAKHLVSGDATLARSALCARLVTDIQTLKRLREDSIDAEMRCFRELAALLIQAIGPQLKREEIVPALELRSARFVAPETLSKCLDATTIPDEKVAWLFFAESCIVGARSRYKIADHIFRISTSENFRNRLNSTQIPAAKRLQILCGLNASALKSGFDPDQRIRMARMYDAMAWDIAQKSRLFETIDGVQAPPAVKVQTMLKLFQGGQVTEGKMSAHAHKMVLGYLGQAGFLTGYLQGWAQSHGGKLDKMAAILELAQGLKKIGLAPDTFLGAMAA